MYILRITFFFFLYRAARAAVPPTKLIAPPPHPRKIETPLLRLITYVFFIKLFRYFQKFSILLKSYLISNRITEIETLWCQSAGGLPPPPP